MEISLCMADIFFLMAIPTHTHKKSIPFIDIAQKKHIWLSTKKRIFVFFIKKQKNGYALCCVRKSVPDGMFRMHACRVLQP
jgi:hypothetical protein